MNGECPSCSAAVHLKSTAKIGHIVVCLKCGSDLEIINLSPIELDWPYRDYNENSEDDEYDDDDNDYDDDDDESDDDDNDYDDDDDDESDD